MKYRVGDMFVSKVVGITSIGLITEEYESNGLRYKITFGNKQDQSRTYSYTPDEINYRFSEEMGWTYYPVVV